MIVKASASATSRRLLMSHLLFVGVGSRPPRDDFLTKARPPSRRWQFRTVQHATSAGGGCRRGGEAAVGTRLLLSW